MLRSYFFYSLIKSTHFHRVVCTHIEFIVFTIDIFHKWLDDFFDGKTIVGSDEMLAYINV